MKFFLVFALIWARSYETEEIKTEENVLVVTKANWDQAVSSDANVLVEFYAPWCGACQALAPEYAKAATQLKELKSDILLAKVDATVETELSEKYEVKEYPTVKFFRKGTPIVYGGGHTSGEIITWLNKKTGPPAKVLEKSEEVKAFVDPKQVAVVGFFADQGSELAAAFLKTAEAIDIVEFAITTPTASGEFDVKEDKIVVFKKFDDLRAEYEGTVDVVAITKFIRDESLPLVSELTDETSHKIFDSGIKSGLLLLISKKHEAFKKHMETFSNVAKGFKGQILFVYVDIDVEHDESILDLFALEPEDCPTLRFIEMEGEDMKKFVPENTELDEESIKSFVDGVMDGKIKLSQAISTDWDKNPVKVLVGKNFKEVAMESSRDVIVEFYAPWCGHCQQLAPIWDKLGEHYKDSQTIIVAKIDATANEVENINIEGFPTIKYFSKGQIIDYNGGRSFDDLVKFVDSRGQEQSPAPEHPEVPDDEYSPEKEHDEGSEDNELRQEEGDHLTPTERNAEEVSKDEL